MHESAKLLILTVDPKRQIGLGHHDPSELDRQRDRHCRKHVDYGLLSVYGFDPIQKSADHLSETPGLASTFQEVVVWIRNGDPPDGRGRQHSQNALVGDGCTQ